MKSCKQRALVLLGILFAVACLRFGASFQPHPVQEAQALWTEGTARLHPGSMTASTRPG